MTIPLYTVGSWIWNVLIAIYSSVELYLRQCHKNSISPTRLIGCVWVELLVGNGQPCCIVYLKRKGKLKTRGTNERKRLGTIPSLKGVATTTQQRKDVDWRKTTEPAGPDWVTCCVVQGVALIYTLYTDSENICCCFYRNNPARLSTCFTHLYKPRSGVCKLP